MNKNDLESMLNDVPVLLADTELMMMGLFKKTGGIVPYLIEDYYIPCSTIQEHEQKGYRYIVLNRDCDNLGYSLMYNALLLKYGHLDNVSAEKPRGLLWEATKNYWNDREMREICRKKVIDLCDRYDV